MKKICFALYLCASVCLFAEEEALLASPLPQEEIAKADVFAFTPPKKELLQDGYTINYNTVSIIEYIRFASKICKANFIYDEKDLNFTVTIVSDEPATPANVMATLLQVLRVHGLILLEQDNNLVIHRASDVRQAATLVTEGGKSNAAIVTRIFRIKYAKPESIAAVILPMISGSAILETSPETRQIILTDITANVDKIALLIENLDSPHTLFEIKSFSVQHNNPDFLITLASQIMTPISQGQPFILVPQNLSGEIFVVSTPELVSKALEVLASLDTSPKNAASKQKTENVFVYKAARASADDILLGLKNISGHLAKSGSDPQLARLIENARVMKETNSIMFVGPDEVIVKVKEFIPALDAGGDGAGERVSFFVYKPHNRSAEDVKAAILELAQNLKGSKGASPGLIETIESARVNPQTHSLSFSGEEKNFARIQELLVTVDMQKGKTIALPAANQFYIYKPQVRSGDEIESAVKEVASQLKSDKIADPALLRALATLKWVKSTNSLMFTGDPESLQKVQQLIATIDVPQASKNDYYIYKVKHTSGELIEEDLDTLAKSFKSSGLKDAKILDVISKIRYVKQTNSLLLSGDPTSLEEVKQLIAQYDYARSVEGPTSSNFYMYKPVHLAPKQLEKQLADVGKNLKNAGLADPSLLKTIEGAKYVETTNSLIFTGSPDTLAKIQTLIKEIDVVTADQSSIQKVGKTTFLLYKLKSASGQQILSSLKTVTGDIKKSGSGDKALFDALQSVKYVRETNSLFFTGSEETLQRVQTLVDNLDVPGMATKIDIPPPVQIGGGATNFFVYRPQSVPGPDLERLLLEFTENLRSSGLNDPELFQAIHSIRWTEKTQTFVFTGGPKALDQVKELLKDFDIPSNQPEAPIATGDTQLSQPIQSIDNTSFLVYKLQFHKGDEIQGALRQIARDLTVANAPVNQGLLNSINSIQWLDVTNSLLCSGDQETLTRLRELIKNLDIPLKQVFIEMLVIQTTLSNALNFGLEWGSNYKYKDKFGASSYNSAPVYGGSPDFFMNKFSSLQPPQTPNPVGNIPVSSGFDLGVIGEVIRHNGETFLTLGSLLKALQTDTESSIVMTPKLITQDGRTSSIFVGENIPFVGSFVQNNSQTTVNTSNIEYRDIGFSLTITPVLGNSDIVTLDINLDRSQTLTNVQGAAIDFNSQSAQGIITSKTNMQTTVHVPDNHFLILSGMVNNSNVKAKSGIPCLGGLPLVGAAFTNNSDTSTNSNIVIFLRPHIINSVDDMRNLTAKEETYFRDQAPTPFLEKHFDEAMELIKTVDDE